jgi:XTP/dITP diphosphohydrolase
MCKSKILLATGNPGKVDEFRNLLADLPVHVVSMKDMDEEFSVLEDGETFTENAVKKAQTAAVHFSCIAVADDSGLEVDALGGQPGVHSARFAGVQGDDEANNDKLLQLLADVPFAERTARFRCSIAIAVPGGDVYTAEGVCEGLIGFERKGRFGFGYDPLFFVADYRMTFAELDMELKNQISHRARAFRKAKNILVDLIQNEVDCLEE